MPGVIGPPPLPPAISAATAGGGACAARSVVRPGNAGLFGCGSEPQATAVQPSAATRIVDAEVKASFPAHDLVRLWKEISARITPE